MHFDPIDTFCSNVKFLINKNQILQIEPTYSSQFHKNSYINNKTRYFFDGLKNFNTTNFLFFNKIKKLAKTLVQTLYIFELNFLKYRFISYFYIVYEYLNLNSLCLLALFKQKYFFFKIINANNVKTNNNLEHTLLFNLIKLNNSNMCLLINSNIKLQNSLLYLKLKQRFLKGSFKLFSISSFFNLVFSFKLLSNNLKTLILITEGRHPICQNIIAAKAPFFIFNSDLYKRIDNPIIYIIMLYLNKFIYFYKLNILNSSIWNTGINLINTDSNNTNKIIYQFSFIYFINIENKNLLILTKIKLLYLTKIINLMSIKKTYLNQNYFNMFSNSLVLPKNSTHFYLPTKNIFENIELFFNTQGIIKQTNKLFSLNNLKSSWKLLRVLLTKLNTVNQIIKKTIFVNYNLFSHFNFIFIIFLFYLAKKIITKNLTINNSNTFIFKNILFNINKQVKYVNTIIKFSLNDFFIGNDGFTNQSLILIKCSKINRIQVTNFF